MLRRPHPSAGRASGAPVRATFAKRAPSRPSLECCASADFRVLTGRHSDGARHQNAAPVASPTGRLAHLSDVHTAAAAAADAAAAAQTAEQIRPATLRLRSRLRFRLRSPSPNRLMGAASACLLTQTHNARVSKRISFLPFAALQRAVPKVFARRALVARPSLVSGFALINDSPSKRCARVPKSRRVKTPTTTTTTKRPTQTQTPSQTLAAMLSRRQRPKQSNGRSVCELVFVYLRRRVAGFSQAATSTQRT